MTNLYDYVFHFNGYTNLWYAVQRDRINDYFNGSKTDFKNNADLPVLIAEIEELASDTSIDTLEQLITEE